MFNSLSKIWLSSVYLFDPVQRLFNGYFWKETKHRFRKYFSGRLLDLACGTGELVDHIKPKEYLGLDINERYVQYAKKYRKRPGVNFIVADIIKANFSPDFETAVLISASHHLSDRELRALFLSLQKKRLKTILIIDGLPRKPFTRFLEYLDAKLGGGSYFRSEDELAKILSPYFKIEKKGRYSVKGSFYVYPYLIATATKP